MSVETEHGTHDPREDNDGCAICRAARSPEPHDAKVVEDWWRAYDQRAGRREATMTPCSRSVEDAFEKWFYIETGKTWDGLPHNELLIHDAYIAGWHAALAAQEQGHAEGTRRIEEGMR